jgi:hypothetical protein
MRPESLGSLYSCQAAFLGTRTRCGQPAVSILRAYCADHDAQALTAARWTLGWTHAVLDLVDKPCTACLPDRRCGGLEYVSHSCPCHHWDRQPLVDGFCSDPTCACSQRIYPLGVCR